MTSEVDKPSVSSEIQTPSIEEWLRELYAKNGCDDPWSIPRHAACRVLKESGIPGYIWAEDAVAYYGVPTALFDVHIVVDDVQKAVDVLVNRGWSSPPAEFQGRYKDIREEMYYLVEPQRDSSETDRTPMDPLNVVVALLAGRYHFDVIAGVSVGTEPYRAHQRKVRDSIRKGEYELCDGSVEKDDERFFTGRVEARLLASLSSKSMNDERQYSL